MSAPADYRNGKYCSPLTYAVKHRDIDTRLASRSGGIFTALSDRILADGGVIYGCVLDEDFRAIHIRAEDSKTRNRMRGSKYIQSEMRDVFRSIKIDLEEGKKVLFSGTSCQVSGLKGYLAQEYENLYCIDVVCHGVPSPIVWQDYIKWQEEKNGSKIKDVDFRNKKDFGWQAHTESLYFENGKRVDSQVFTTLFYGHSILRPSCYQCPYKDVIHPSEITIADYWGIDNVDPEFNDNKGVSLVLINDDKGKRLFESVIDDIELRETRIEDSMQMPLHSPFSVPNNRNSVWTDYYNLPFKLVVKKYGGVGVRFKVRRKIREFINLMH